jgi:hypothetical protein
VQVVRAARTGRMTDEHEHDDAEEMKGFSLVLPFVCCVSNGGPFDDDSFVAGFSVGEIRTILSMTTHARQVGFRYLEGVGVAVSEYRATVRSDLVPQLDLVAMEKGFTMTSEVTDIPEWSDVTFTRIRPDGDDG